MLQRFRSGFRFRLLLIFIIATLVVSTAYVSVFIAIEIQSYNERLSEKAHLLASILANSARIPLFSGDRETLAQHSKALLETPNVVRVVITAADGKVFSDVSSPIISKSSSLIAATAQVKTTDAFSSTDSELAGLPATDQTVLGVVTVYIDKSDIRSFAVRSIVFAILMALTFCAVVSLVSYPVLSRVTRSFQVLITGLNTMMTGDFSLKIPVESDDEAGRAAITVNRLAEALVEREAENHNLQEELVRAMQHELTQEKQKMMAKLIQTNRMTTIGLLVSCMAHNINTPNGAVKMAGQNLARSWKDVVPILDSVSTEEGNFIIGGLSYSIAREELQKAAESVVHNADRIDRVINDLRCYSVGVSWEFTPFVSVNKVVEGGLSVIRAHGKFAAIPISHHLDLAVPYVNGNQYQLEQVVVNLLQNALLAMKTDDGKVTISTKYDKECNEVLMIVQDEGEGITKDALRSLDEPFVSTRLDRGGSGLGLYISNFLVKEHEGRISFQAEQGRGTIAMVHLPAIC